VTDGMPEAAHEAWALFAERRFREALPLVERAVEAAPDAWELWADLAVAAKHALDFARCLEACERALALGGGGSGLYWNLGIAGTAMGRWAAARRGWLGCELPVPGGLSDEELRWPLGLTPVRVAREGAPEVLWCERLCPARALILSIPTPETGRRYGDVLLHDGEPRGQRIVEGRKVAVFEELQRLTRSAYGTSIAEIEVEGPGAVQDLLELLEEAGDVGEDWTGGLTLLCAACSEGRPHERHDTALEGAWSRRRDVAVASRGDPSPVLRAWLARGAGRRVLGLHVPPE
jgi:hypothetical protein